MPAPSAAQTDNAVFTLQDVKRDGKNVTFDVSSSRTVFGAIVSLSSGGSLVALPEQHVSQWNAGDKRSLKFQLMRDVESASLTFKWSDEGEDRQQSIGVPIPSSDSTGDTPARVLVDQVTLAGSDLRVNLTNAGGTRSGDLIVSIEDSSGRKIGNPYYRTVASLAPGAQGAALFTAPAGLATTVVVLEYAGKTERVTVAVRSGTGGDSSSSPTNVTLTSDLPFQDVDVGRSRDFAVTVRNTGRAGLVRLDVEGLPANYGRSFFVGGTSTSTVFLAQNQSRLVTLSVTAPSAETEVNRAIEFTMVAKVEDVVTARLPMGVHVRGVGKLEVSGTNLFGSVPPGGTGRFTVTVTNTGTAPLHNVALDERRPFGWSIRFEPSRLDRLDPGESRAVSVEVRAPDVIAPGLYATDVSAKAGSTTSRVVTLEVEIPAQGGTGGGWLWFVFLGLMAGTLGWAYWKRRRG